MKLFEKEGYTLTNHSEHFKETEYRKRLDRPKEYYETVLAAIAEVEDVDGLFKEWFTCIFGKYWAPLY